MIKLLVDERNK